MRTSLGNFDVSKRINDHTIGAYMPPVGTFGHDDTHARRQRTPNGRLEFRALDNEHQATLNVARA
jgi:hypothetical protein